MLGFLTFLSALAPARAASFPAVERSTAPIIVVYPTEGLSIPPSDGEFVLGSVSDPRGHLEIDGSTVSVYRTGAFLAWLPVSPGTFTFHCSLALGSTVYAYARQISVAAPLAPLPQKPVTIDESSLVPSEDLELRPGDWLVARARASPGQDARFRLGRGGWQPMREAGAGFYEGAWLVPAGYETGPASVQFRVGHATAKTSAEVSVRSETPLTAVVRGGSFVNVKTGPAGGEYFPALGGTRFLTGGSAGDQTKLLLGDGTEGWVETKSLDFLPAGAAPPQAVTDSISLHSEEDGTVLHIGLSDRVPFTVQENDALDGLTVRLHYTRAHTRWILYDPKDDFVDEVRVAQEPGQVVAVHVRLKPGRKLWGFDPEFNSGLRVVLRRPPRIARSALAGRIIFLDPGHMPSRPGAIGGLGTREMDVNYAIAEDVESLLRAAGARPLMSRSSPSDEVGLADRPRMALAAGAELFVSIHNNNLPGETNPFRGGPHGYSVFYYEPHSFALAKAIYRAYGGRVPLPGEELRYGDLLVARISPIPAVLTESAYLTYPEQEALLLDAGFRRKLASAIVDGIRTFLEGVRDGELAADKLRDKERS